MAKVYGIDLGTTYSAIATLDDSGLPEIIENYDDSVPILASALYFPEDGDPVIGKEAKNQVDMYPDRVVQFIKRKIGKPDAGKYNFNGVEYDPITLSALILKRMKEYAEEQGHEVNDVVITCPAYFGTEERMATSQAGKIAGLNVLNIVNEPTAAALNYCCKEFSENRKIMVYDLGGGTFDITIFNFSVNENNESNIEVIATDGNDILGGADWDNCLFKLICEKYEDETGVAESEMEPELKAKIRSVVEDTKKALSKLPSKSFTINYGDSTRIDVSREEFEECTAHLVAQTESLVQKLLSSNNFTSDDIDTVLLVGGSTKMPMVKNMVENLFGKGKVRVEEPDLAVAKGAALAAAIAWNEGVVKETLEQGGSLDDIQPVEPGSAEAESGEDAGLRLISVGGGKIDLGGFQDKLSRSFGPAILTENDEYMIDNLLFIGDPSPSVLSKTYGTVADNQKKVEIKVFENVATDKVNTYVTPCLDINGNDQPTDPVMKVKYLGIVSLEMPPNTPKGSPIEVTFDFSTKGLIVTAKNGLTGETISAEIISPNGLTEDEVEEASTRISAIRTKGQI